MGCVDGISTSLMGLHAWVAELNLGIVLLIRANPSISVQANDLVSE